MKPDNDSLDSSAAPGWHLASIQNVELSSKLSEFDPWYIVTFVLDDFSVVIKTINAKEILVIARNSGMRIEAEGQMDTRDLLNRHVDTFVSSFGDIIRYANLHGE